MPRLYYPTKEVFIVKKDDVIEDVLEYFSY